MKVKMIDVARKLGVSKATVSLALNGKPGVNEETRKKILECMEELKNQGDRSLGQSSRYIEVVIINHEKQVICDPELDLWSGVLAELENESRRHGYLFGLAYLNDAEDNAQQVIARCNQDHVAGVLIFATEMNEEDRRQIEQIDKPVVLYDYETLDGAYSSVCVDNRMAVRLAMDRLWENGIRRIQYLSNSKEIYNFSERRQAYWDFMLKKGMQVQKSDMTALGSNINEITQNARTYLQTHPLPEAFVMENYQISIGVLSALRQLNIAVPQRISLIGVDELPDYMTGGVALTQIQIPHPRRAALAIELLAREIESDQAIKSRILAFPKLIPGQSVAVNGKN